MRPTSRQQPHPYRHFNRKGSIRDFSDNDPLTGVANLFDLGLVFMVGLLVAVFYAYHLEDLFKEESEVTITKQRQDGSMEIIVKKGKQIEAVKTTDTAASGKGTRLGVAYRLNDGSMVYVPDQEE